MGNPAGNRQVGNFARLVIPRPTKPPTMNRRQLLQGMAAAAALPLLGRSEEKGSVRPSALVKPPRLRAGDTVAMISPSSGLTAANFDKAVSNIEALGLKVRIGRHARGNHGIFSGTDRERLEDLHWAFSDPEIHGVWCARGGNGSQRLLPELDFAMIRRNPKVFVGYSDITALHMAIQQRCGLVTFHGPLGSSTFSDYTKRLVLDAVMNPVAPYRIESSTYNQSQQSDLYRTQVITPGRARGRLVGGNLTLLASLVGTPWALGETAGRILFFEAVDEPPWRVERMLTQLGQSVDLRKLAGVAVGIMAGCEPTERFPSPPLFEVVRQHLSELGIPAIYGLSFGHIRDVCTLPMGLDAELDTASATVTLLEAGVT